MGCGSKKEMIQRGVDAALGRIPCDLQIQQARFLDVFSLQWKTADISILDGRIVAVDSGLKAKREISGKDKWVVPGFIDAHVHVESSLLIPKNFDGMVVSRGTTTAICDPHELANVMGLEGIRYFLTESEKLNLDLRVMLSSCVPATLLETNGGGKIGAEDLKQWRTHAKVLGLAEMMNMPGVLHNDPGVMAMLEAFSAGIIDGHAPCLRGKDLSAYIGAGISTCHESTELDEAAEKVSKGMAVWIREGSVAKDLEKLIPLLNTERSLSIGFCTDDRNPLDILTEGHVDHLVRQSIRRGVAPELAYRCASLSVARHYGLRDRGGIAPGQMADLILLGDKETCEISDVLIRGKRAEELEFSVTAELVSQNSVRASVPSEKDLAAPSGSVRVIGIREGSILTDSLTMHSNDSGVARLTVLERHGQGHPPANAYVYGFGKHFNGAIASSVAHDSHNLIVAGSNVSDMRIAISALILSGGGFVVVMGREVRAQLPLPFAGLMTFRSPREVQKQLQELHLASRQTGCELKEPFLQLAFLSLPVIPKLKLTDRGLVDVEKFSFTPVSGTTEKLQREVKRK